MRIKTIVPNPSNEANVGSFLHVDVVGVGEGSSSSDLSLMRLNEGDGDGGEFCSGGVGSEACTKGFG